MSDDTMTSEQVRQWLAEHFDSHKVKGSAAIGVSRPTLDRMLREGADLTKTLAMRYVALHQEQSMNTITTDLIDAHFTRWGSSSTPTEGFVTYCWDEREETLADLRADDRRNLVSDIVYSLKQDARHEDIDLNVLVVHEWLDACRDGIIAAIVESLEE